MGESEEPAREGGIVDLGLRGKVAIVTGSSRGIGRAIATALAGEGCAVALAARGQEDLAEAARGIASAGGQAMTFSADLTAGKEVAALVDQTLARFGRVDILVNNLGGSRGSSFTQTSDEEMQAALDLNLFSAIRASRLVVPAMRRQGGRGHRPHLVHLGTRGGRTGGLQLGQSGGDQPGEADGP